MANKKLNINIKIHQTKEDSLIAEIKKLQVIGMGNTIQGCLQNLIINITHLSSYYRMIDRSLLSDEALELTELYQKYARE